MKIIFADINPKLTAQIMTYFADEPDVEVHTGDIFAHKADAIVSPANSFGFMDGGIDLVYSKHFGWELETAVQQAIAEKFEGELLVGQATIVPTGNEEIPWLVAAPTMRVPMHIDGTVNAYLSFRAVLRAVKEHNECTWDCPFTGITHHKPDTKKIHTILCPGLGTAVGNLDPKVGAVQLLYAYNEVIKGQKFEQPGIHAAYRAHHTIARGII
jgi:O-acetyl-ADP-ribose deacetylase (regulator of RNase III)